VATSGGQGVAGGGMREEPVSPEFPESSPDAAHGPVATVYRTKAQIVHEYLKEAIVNGTLPPGERLNIRTLSHKLGVSQTPVREALRLLAQEGLVVINPHSDARVADLPLEGLEENMLIRAELEGLATRLAAPHITPEVMAELEQLCGEMDRCVQRRDLVRYGELNRRFHLTIYRCSPYRRLYGLIEELLNQVPRARSVFALAPDYVRRSQETHRAILEALKSGDGERAGALVRQQKLEAREVLMAHGQSLDARGKASWPPTD